MTDIAAIKERYDDIIRRLDAPKMGNPKYLMDRVQIEGELRSLTRKLLALLADTPSVEPLDVETIRARLEALLAENPTLDGRLYNAGVRAALNLLPTQASDS